MTSFRILTAEDFGAAADYVDGIPIGPGTDSTCTRYKIATADEFVSRIKLHVSETIIGVTVTVGDRTGSFGITSSRDEVIYDFTEEQQLIGIYGF